MAFHRYWRINANSVTNNNSYPVNIVTLEMLDDDGGTNLALAGNGTASASSVSGSLAAANAFDANSTTRWLSSGNVPQWIQWDFGVATDIRQIVIRNSNEGSGSYFITSGNVQWSDDGSAWTTIHTFSGLPVLTTSIHTFDLIEPSSGSITVTMPAAVARGYGGATGAVTMPAAVARGYGGATGAVTMPAAVARGYGGATGAVTMPAAVAYAVATDETGLRAAHITMPMVVALGYGGGNAAALMPVGLAMITGTAVVRGYADISMPRVRAAGAGTMTATGRSATTLSLPIEARGYGGANGAASMPASVAAGAGLTGIVGRAALVVPLFEVTASGTIQNVGSAHIVMPAARLGDTGRGDACMPMGVVVGTGYVVVAVTYEAYALNLKHSNPDSPDELTRYTNFPFDRIVRYKNSYYGMNSTGLYLLEGTTDNGAPIPWSYRTHLTDFKSAQLKNIDTIYFGGRMGPASSVSVHVGEAGVQSYAYTTPRGIVAQNHRQTTGKGMRSRYYAVGASGEGEMTLDTLTINVANLARKV